MKEDLIFDLIELTGKIPCDSEQSNLLRMAMLVEKILAKMEAEGTLINRDTFHKAIRDQIKKYDHYDKVS